MANTNTQEVFSKIILRNDVLTEWEGSSIILEKGEIALEMDATNKVAKIKVGNGSSTFAQLPYSTMTPAEITAAISNAVSNDAITSLSVESGSTNGTIKVIIDGTAHDNIAVKGLGSAAYQNTSAFATSAQGTKADNAMPKAGGTFTGAVKLAADPTEPLGAATKQFVENAITTSIAAADAMTLKGTIGTSGTVTALPTGAADGDTYKAISAVSIPAASSFSGAAENAKAGDLITAMPGGKWLLVPSGNEDVTSVRFSKTQTNLAETAKTGEVILGEAATKQVVTAVDTSANLPTANAVKTFVEGKGYTTTDQKVKTTPGSAEKIYLAGTTSATETTGTQKINTKVYVGTDNKLHAEAGFSGDVTGTADKAKTLTSGIAASVSGGANGTGAAANAGGTIAINITNLNTDYLTNGTKTLVLNGGSATA